MNALPLPRRRGPKPSPLSFRERVMAGCVKHGIETKWIALTADTVIVTARVAYGPWRSVSLFAIRDGSCLSENGAVMGVSDVVQRLRSVLRSRSSS
jgi:hypothetical protein